MLRNINTYGELCDEIERVEKVIDKIRHGVNYERGDEMDFQLYLISLKKIKAKNERKWKMMQDFGIYDCDKCGSIMLDKESVYDFRDKAYVVEVKCQDCGYEKEVSIRKADLKGYPEIVDEINIWEPHRPVPGEFDRREPSWVKSTRQ